MSKLTVLVLAAVAVLVASQEGDTGNSNSCASDWKGTEPQVKGKSCGQVSKDDCTFIDEVIKCCPNECSNATPAPEATTAGPLRQAGKKKKKACFHGDDLVQTRQYGTIKMSELANKRDAEVLTRSEDGQLEYASVRYWLHAQPSISMKFFQLRTQSGHRLALTGEHLIYETDCQGGSGRAIFAKNVQVGRCLYVNQDGNLIESPVIEKAQEKMIGVYSPITYTGSIVVNDVLASCYNYYENESLQKWVYQYMILSQDALAKWLPTSLYEAAFNNQNGVTVTVPRIILNFLQLSNVLVH